MATIEGITRALYDAMSFTDPATIDWDRLRWHMAQGALLIRVLSTYEARPRKEDPRVLWRGINSIQLYWRDGRWWVSSILWTRESAEAPIPAEYLP